MKKTFRNLSLVFAAGLLTTACQESDRAPEDSVVIVDTENDTSAPTAEPVSKPTKAEPSPSTVQDIFSNASRPDYLEGVITLPATSSYPETEYLGGSGGKTSEFPSIPYGIHAVTGERKSPYIGGLSGDDDVFMIKSMYDAKLGRNRTYMLFHQATEPDSLLSQGCVTISREEYPKFKLHIREVLKEYGQIEVTILPGPNGGARFTVDKVKPVKPAASLPGPLVS